MKLVLFMLTTLILSGYTFAQLTSIGSMANSQYGELLPYITPDGNKLFFIRENHPNNSKFGDTQDIWMCSMKNDEVTTEAKHLGFPFNTIGKNALCYQSPDGQTRIIKGVFDKQGVYKRSGYSQCTLTEKGWSDPEPLDIRSYDFMCRGQYVGMCMSPGRNVMILSFSEKKNDPKSELYLSRYKGGNNWTKPEKLPFTVSGDFAPYIAADNKTLYFASDARGGLGSADIFVAKRLDEEWKKWTNPENVGNEINTPNWDAYFTVSPSGKNAFIVNDKSGSSDIYRLNLDKPTINKVAKPDPVIIVEGIVKDAETGKFLNAELIYTNLDSNAVQGVGKSAASDGQYKVVLPYGIDFSVNAQLKGYYAESIHLDLKKFGEFTTVKQDILMRPIKMETVIRLNNIFFETNKTELLPTSISELEELVKILTENPGLKIELRGHTDNVGTDESNLKLSAGRAEAVKNYLLSKNIAPDRLSSNGYGETIPVSSNDTPEGKQLNRRVEFKIIGL